MKRKLRNVENTWPILPGSENPPPQWKRWPNGKQFAFVLTHDVESQVGIRRVSDLMKVEMEEGFVSSFNFVPEGGSPVTPKLRDELVERGFEVGVHDLKHNGLLYHSRKAFSRNAARINHYLQSWGAVGFRSAFMLNKLDWLHELNIEYDASTFDTDPFEPQPDGLGTIFPRWQDNGAGRGYVELPYTLPQDSTLFLLFNQRDISTWLRKLDWVAQNGGMALVNVHPDYMDFGNGSSRFCYPVDFYRKLLSEVSARYGNDAWCALPREVARHVSENRTAALATSA